MVSLYTCIDRGKIGSLLRQHISRSDWVIPFAILFSIAFVTNAQGCPSVALPHQRGFKTCDKPKNLKHYFTEKFSRNITN